MEKKMAINPISPNDVQACMNGLIPDAVIEIFNEAIVAKFDGTSARVTVESVVPVICERLGCARNRVFDSHWLDIEDIFKKAGWSVEWHKAPYYSMSPSYWIFTKTKP